jgi:hypothetical protein
MEKNFRTSGNRRGSSSANAKHHGLPTPCFSEAAPQNFVQAVALPSTVAGSSSISNIGNQTVTCFNVKVVGAQ